MSRRDLDRRLERLEARLGATQSRLEFHIRFVEPGGRIVSRLLLEEGRQRVFIEEDGAIKSCGIGGNSSPQ
jgi:hypothetical protein